MQPLKASVMTSIPFQTRAVMAGRPFCVVHARRKYGGGFAEWVVKGGNVTESHQTAGMDDARLLMVSVLDWKSHGVLWEGEVSRI